MKRSISALGFMLGISLFLSSCVTYYKSTSELEALSEDNYSTLNGTYAQIITESGYFNLPEFVKMNYQSNYLFFNAGDTVLSAIRLLDKQTLLLKVYHNNVLVGTDTLAGEIKKNYFYIGKQRYKDLSEGPVLHTICKSKTRIGLSNSNDLIVDNVNQFMIRLFYIPITIKDEHFNDLIFKKSNYL